MGLETGTTFADLVSSNPDGGDKLYTVDDHVRLVKSVLKSQFPGAAGNGLDSPIVATEAELNNTHGTTSSIQSQLDALAARIAALGG